MLVGGAALVALLVLLIMVSGSFARVDSTEHCVLTRYGTVIRGAAATVIWSSSPKGSPGSWSRRSATGFRCLQISNQVENI